jgi:hypothetical protein
MLQFVAKMIMILFIITREKKGFIMVCFDYTYSVEISNTTPHLDKKMVGPYIYKIDFKANTCFAEAKVIFSVKIKK